eukprot:CAMPEP_0184694386 /NCGR_PEP_ID=MMETSP0313-20130426/2373_1 /TAXON_ID=2792 /ORGANISM="Porphyridium aerugineum, Strain SAG 1380-2" /LENGTH=1288 /DNA_ID=CAMNT_0027152677 /DNA_START=150 /DNA_END=4016 /DNA_ORIENTATION=-
MSTFSVGSLIDKMNAKDRDYRYMALSDLLNELAKETFVADSESQKKICRHVLQLLKDNSSEVQGLAIRCLAPLCRRVPDALKEDMVDKLCAELLAIGKPAAAAAKHGSDESAFGMKSSRDVASLSLKSIVTELPANDPACIVVSKRLMPQVIAGIQQGNLDDDLKLECLELLNEALNRVSGGVSSFHKSLKTVLVPEVTASRPIVRKRASQCIANVCASCNETIFSEIVTHFETLLSNSRSKEQDIAASLQLYNAISKVCSYRLVPYLDRLVPLLIGVARNPKYEGNYELRENCLSILETLVQKQGYALKKHVHIIVELAIESMKFDPNYIGDDEDGEEAGSMDAGQGEDEDEEGGDMEDGGESDAEEISDDDDSSWKIRRAGVKCLEAVVDSQLLAVRASYEKVGTRLIESLTEREEAVRIEVFSALEHMLQVIMLSVPRLSTSLGHGSIEGQESHDVKHTLGLLRQRVPRIIKIMQKQTASRNLKIRAGVLALLRALISLLPDQGVKCIESLRSGLHTAFADPNLQIRSEVLPLFSKFVSGNHPPSSMVSNLVSEFFPDIITATDDKYYKIAADALRLCSTIIETFGTGDVPVESLALVSIRFPEVLDSAMRRLDSSDEDTEVREAAIVCAQSAVACFGQLFPDKSAQAASYLVQKLQPESSRLSAARALKAIAESANADVLRTQAESVFLSFTTYLRTRERLVVEASLEGLIELTRVFDVTPNDELFANITQLIGDEDQRLTSLVLCLCSIMVQKFGSEVVPMIELTVWTRVDVILKSTSAIAITQNALLSLIDSLAELDVRPLDYQSTYLFFRRFSVEWGASSRAYNALPAKCISILCKHGSPEQRALIIDDLLGKSRPRDQPDISIFFALSCVCELGRSSVFSSGQSEAATQMVLQALETQAEEVRTLAAQALGAISSGNGKQGFIDLVQLIEVKPNMRYLLLTSLKEAISHINTADAKDLTPLILSMLNKMNTTGTSAVSTPGDSSVNEESIRSISSECLGLLTGLTPSTMLPELQKMSGSQDPQLRAVSIMALRHAMNGGVSGELLSLLGPMIPTFLGLLNDTALIVRKSSLVTLNALIRSVWHMVEPFEETVLVALHKETQKDQSLVRVVNLGPFQYVEDDGLDLRKAAFESLITLIHVNPLHVDISDFTAMTVHGMKDHQDVRALAQLALISMSQLPSAANIVLEIEPLTEALTEALSATLKSNAVKQEIERHEDSLRSGLKTVKALNTVTEITRHPSWMSFMTDVVRAPRLVDKYNAVEYEPASRGFHTMGAPDAMEI